MAMRLVNLHLVGCWLYSYAIGEINSLRRAAEGRGFEPTVNLLPPWLRAMGLATLGFWLACHLCRAWLQGAIDWSARELVHLRLAGEVGLAPLRGAGEGWSQDSLRARCEGNGSAAEGMAVLLPESAGPCGLKAPLTPGLLVGTGLVFGRRPCADDLGRSPGTGTRLGTLRECSLRCKAGWCAVDAPRISPVHCAVFRRGDGFVLFDYSPNGVYLNGAPLSAAPAIELTQEEETEAELIAGPASLPWRAGRAVRFGDRISLMVCASPHAEICYQLLPASEQSWGWISSQVEAERAGLDGAQRPCPTDELRQLLERTVLLEQRQLSCAAQRRSVGPAIVWMLLVLGLGLWHVTSELDCTACVYLSEILNSLRRTQSDAVPKPTVHAARMMVQPPSILFLWWLLYSCLMALMLLGFCLGSGGAAGRRQKECESAEHAVSAWLASRGPTEGACAKDADSEPKADREPKPEAEPATAEAAAEAEASRLLNASLLAACDDTRRREAASAVSAGAALSAAVRAQNEEFGRVAPSDYTSPHQLGAEELRCPISLAPMAAAVSVLPCGHVFDRPSLVSYIASANKGKHAARCPLQCDSRATTIVVNRHVRQAVAAADSRKQQRQQAAEATVQDEDDIEEYGDEDSVASIFGSAEILAAYRALLADTALPTVFDCATAKPRQLDSLMIALEGFGWYNPTNNPLDDLGPSPTEPQALVKLNAMLRVMAPLSVEPQPNGQQWLLQPARILVLLTQILRRSTGTDTSLQAPGASARAKCSAVVVRLLSKVVAIIAGQSSPELLLRLVRAARTVEAAVALLGAHCTKFGVTADKSTDKELATCACALDLLQSCVVAHPALAVDVVTTGLLERPFGDHSALRSAASSLGLQLLAASLQPAAQQERDWIRLSSARAFVKKQRGWSWCSWGGAGGSNELQLWALQLSDTCDWVLGGGAYLVVVVAAVYHKI